LQEALVALCLPSGGVLFATSHVLFSLILEVHCRVWVDLSIHFFGLLPIESGLGGSSHWIFSFLATTCSLHLVLAMIILGHTVV
jgi:hypothetical protein